MVSLGFAPSSSSGGGVPAIGDHHPKFPRPHIIAVAPTGGVEASTCSWFVVEACTALLLGSQKLLKGRGRLRSVPLFASSTPPIRILNRSELQEFSLAELRQVLEVHGLRTTGDKKMLIRRLLENIDEEQPQHRQMRQQQVLTSIFTGGQESGCDENGLEKLKELRSDPFDAGGDGKSHEANKRDDHRRQRLLQLPMAEIHARANARRLPLLGTKDDIVMRLLSEDYPKIWFKAGDVVDFRCPRDESINTAVVQRENPQGTLTVRLEDGYEETTHWSNLQLRRMTKAEYPWKAGDEVEAMTLNSDWLRATFLYLTGDDRVYVSDTTGKSWPCTRDEVRDATPRLSLREIRFGEPCVGRVTSTFRGGAFMDVNATELAVLHGNCTYAGDTPKYEVGDHVKAYCRMEGCYFGATIKSVPEIEGGYYEVAFKEGVTVNSQVRKRELIMVRPRRFSVIGYTARVWVKKVSTDKLEVVAAEDKLMRSKRRQDVSGFDELRQEKTALIGRVCGRKDYGLLLEACHPRGYPLCFGLLHISKMGRFVENLDEYNIGDQVRVRVCYVCLETGGVKYAAVEEPVCP